MSRNKKWSKWIMGILSAMLLLTSNTVAVHAREIETDLITLKKQQDLTVLFHYEGQRPEIVFISPKGDAIRESDTTGTKIESAHGEHWSTYKIYDAEAGKWKVRCNKRDNLDVNFSIVEEIDGLCIQNFDIVSIEQDKAKLNFLVTMGEDDDIYYRYTISAVVDDNNSGGRALKSGRAKAGDEQELEIDLLLSSFKGYRLLLEVTVTDGMEMYDSMLTEPFDFENPNTPQAMQDCEVWIDLSNSFCQVDWKAFKPSNPDGYHLVIFVNENTSNPIYTNSLETTQDAFYYPTDTTKLIINLYYKEKEVLSKVLQKEIDLVNGEGLKIVTSEITSDGQVEMKYNALKPSVLNVTINEQTGQYNILGDASAFFPLQQGKNDIEAFFLGTNNITYQISSSVYLNTVPPLLTIYEDIDGMTFKKKELLIAGRTEHNAKLFINDVEVPLDENGVFSQMVVLTEGENTITIVAQSVNGISTYKSMNVICESDVSVTAIGSNYRPLVFSLLASIVVIMIALRDIFKKASQKVQMGKWHTYQRFSIKFGVVISLLELCAIASYIYFYRINHSAEFAEVVKISLEKAVESIRYQEYSLKTIIIFAVLLVLNLVIGLIARSCIKAYEAKHSRVLEGSQSGEYHYTPQIEWVPEDDPTCTNEIGQIGTEQENHTTGE